MQLCTELASVVNEYIFRSSQGTWDSCVSEIILYGTINCIIKLIVLAVECDWMRHMRGRCKIVHIHTPLSKYEFCIDSTHVAQASSYWLKNVG